MTAAASVAGRAIGTATGTATAITAAGTATSAAAAIAIAAPDGIGIGIGTEIEIESAAAARGRRREIRSRSASHSAAPTRIRRSSPPVGKGVVVDGAVIGAAAAAPATPRIVSGKTDRASSSRGHRARRPPTVLRRSPTASVPRRRSRSR